MMCETCGHEHVKTEQAVRYTNLTWEAGQTLHWEDVVESTLMICSEPGCRCYELSPTDYEDRISLIKSGELDP